MGCCDSAARAKAFSSIDGTRVYYWRDTPGSPHSATFRCSSGFYDRLVGWIRDLRSLSKQYGSSSYSSLRYLVSAGTYVCRSDGCVSYHNYGRAFDLDYVRWYNTSSSPYGGHHRSSTLYIRRRYLAVDALSRRHFRYVLDGYYNSAHRDHIHLDDSGMPTVCRTGSRSDTVFVQKVCNDFMGKSLAVDGIWGPATNKAFSESRTKLNVVVGDPRTSATAYRHWAGRVAAHGFANKPIGTFRFSRV